MKIFKGIIGKKNLKLIGRNVILGTLIASTLTLSGCGNKDIGITLGEEITENHLIYSKVESYDSEKVKSNSEYYIEGAESFNQVMNPVEFSKFIGNENTTWEDIRNSINNNDNITQYVKDTLLKGIENLEKNDLKISLGTLKYNMDRLQIENLENINDEPEDVLAYFDDITGKVVIEDDAYKKDFKSEYVLFHEILGHGMVSAYDEENKIRVTPDVYYYAKAVESKFGTVQKLGVTYREGMAEMFAILALGRPVSIHETNSAYGPSLYNLSLIMESNNISLSELANNDMNYLVEKMKNNNFEIPYTVLGSLDLFNFIEYRGVDLEFKAEDLIMLYVMCYKQGFKEMGMSDEEINANFANYLNAYKKYLVDDVIPTSLGEFDAKSFSDDMVSIKIR